MAFHVTNILMASSLNSYHWCLFLNAHVNSFIEFIWLLIFQALSFEVYFDFTPTQVIIITSYFFGFSCITGFGCCFIFIIAILLSPSRLLALFACFRCAPRHKYLADYGPVTKYVWLVHDIYYIIALIPSIIYTFEYFTIFATLLLFRHISRNYTNATDSGIIIAIFATSLSEMYHHGHFYALAFISPLKHDGRPCRRLQ